MNHKLRPLVVALGTPLCVVTGSLTLLSMTPIAQGGQPIFYPNNGHYYEVVTDEVLWPDAKAAADARVHRGMYGHLATITSESENNFIVEDVMGKVTSAWIGGFQPDGSPEPDGGWRWVTGEPFDYTHWGPGQPDQNGGEDENAIELKGLDSAFPYEWHDQAGDTDFFPYVVEYSFVFNPENGHYYELVTDEVLWPDANAAARVRVYRGMYGHLATITSESENNFVVAMMTGVVTSAYIGGFQPEGSQEPDGGWRWVNGEPFGYTNWGSGQPDQNGGEDENAIELKGLDSDFPYDWPDQAGYTDFFPYIVEYSPPHCPSDFDGDGDVGVKDLLELLGNWGSCVP